MTVGIICEYNPLHLGHQKQIHKIREHFGAETVIVCAMSGNFVQRGAPAILEKTHRAKAAVLCGADLVLELPMTTSLSSAEGFAAGGVQILGKLCDYLCFGAETADAEALMKAAQVYAGMQGRDYVLPDDVKKVAVPVMAHRVIVRTQNTIRLSDTGEQIISYIVDTVKAPIE